MSATRAFMTVLALALGITPGRAIHAQPTRVDVVASHVAAVTPWGYVGEEHSTSRATRPVGVCLPGDPRCPPPDVTITPAGGTFATASQSVTIDWCGHAPLDPSSEQIVFNGVNVTASFSFVTSVQSGCSSHATSSGTITLPAGNSTLSATIQDNIAQSGSASASYTYAGSAEGVTISLAAHNGTNRDVSLCVANCFDQVISYSTPSYRSLDRDRSLTLIYRSSQASPTATVTLDVVDTAAGKTASLLSLQILDGNGTPLTQLNGQTETFFANQTGQTLRIAGQFDASGLTSGAYVYSAAVKSYYTDATTRTTTRSVRVLVVNERSSPYGAGWSVAGLQRLYPEASGYGVSIVDGAGSMQYFSGPCTGNPCTYASPAGDYTTVSRTAAGGWTRRTPDGTTINFDASGYETSVADRFGNTVNYSYSGARLYSATDPVGQVISVSAVAGGYSITDPASRVSTVTLDGANRATDIQDPAGGHPFSAPLFDASGYRLSQWTDRRAGIWNGSYDCAGHAGTLTAPTIVADGVSQRPQTRGQHVDVQTTGCATGSGTSGAPYTATLAANVTASTTDARNHATTYVVDAFLAPTRITDALGRVTTIQRDIYSRVLSTTSPTNHTINYTWDGPRLTQQTDAATGATISTAYELTYSRPTHIWGNTTEQWFYYTGAVLDSSRAPTATTPVTRYRTDSRGRVWDVTDPGGHETTTAFETTGLQNTSSATAPGNRVTTFRHDNVGRVSATVHADGSVDSTAYDALNRVRVTRDGSYHSTTYDYDSLFLTTVTDAKGQHYTYAPDALGWIEQEVRPNTATPIRRQFDANGNVTSVTNRRGGVVNYTYDALDRVVTQNAVTDGQTTTYGYSAWSGGSYQAL